jgi:hypothetical protein
MLPRTARKLSAIPQSRLLASKIPITSYLAINLTTNEIHTRQPQKLNNTAAANTSSRWFTAIPIPSLAQSIGMFTGNAALTSKNDRIMQRVWEKRKQRLVRATTGILEKFKSKKINFETAEIYIRKAGSFDDAEDNGQREVHIALRGIAHTVVVLKCGAESYLLDRVVEGIRVTELQMNDETRKIEKCNKFKPEEMVKLSTFKNINLSSVCIAEWINKESQTQYNVITNNCVQFSFYFYQQFLSGLKAKQFIHSLIH